MPVRYFKKYDPKVKIMLSSGDYVQFERADGGYGLFHTDNEQVGREFEAMIQRQAGGIAEVSEAEYRELKKKAMTSPRNWREELSKHSAGQMAGQRRTNQPDPGQSVAVSEPAPTGPSMLFGAQTDFRPNARKVAE